MVTLHLYGYLAEKFGDTIELAVSTPREAVTAMAHQVDTYRNYLVRNNWHIFRGSDDNLKEDMIDMEISSGESIHLIPAIEGSNNSSDWTMIGGAALMIVGAVLSPFTGGATLALVGVGAGMMGYGYTQKMKKAMGKLDNEKDTDKFGSFLFQGPENVHTQGGALPVGYGRMRIGSTIISTGMYAEQLRIPRSVVFDELYGHEG